MSLDRAYYTSVSISLIIILLPYLEAAYPSAVAWLPSKLSLKGESTLHKSFLALIAGGLGLSISWLINMTGKLVHVSALEDDTAHKVLYIARSDEFRSNPRLMEELKQWKAGNNNYNYSYL